MNTSSRIVSVNVSLIRHVERNGKSYDTGIFKKPVAGPVRVGVLGLEGDQQGDKEHHGGEHMALYAYTVANYDYWRAELNDPALPFGKFGENLTIDGLDETDVAIGDRFAIGADVQAEVSLPRAPCGTLAMVMGDPSFAKKFRERERLGFYLRVLKEGTVQVGDEVRRTHRGPARLSVAEVMRLMYIEQQSNLPGVKRALTVPALGPRWRERFQKMVEDAQTSPS